MGHEWKSRSLFGKKKRIVVLLAEQKNCFCHVDFGKGKKRASKCNDLGTHHCEGEGKPVGEQIRLHIRVWLCSGVEVSEGVLDLDHMSYGIDGRFGDSPSSGLCSFGKFI